MRWQFQEAMLLSYLNICLQSLANHSVNAYADLSDSLAQVCSLNDYLKNDTSF